jgi:hypothetical protein
MEADNTFSDHFSLAFVEDLEAFATAWEFPSGRQVDPATVGPREFTPSWSLNGRPAIRGETKLLPSPVCVAVNPEGAEPWLGVFNSDGSGRNTQAVIALPDGETFAVLSDGDAYRAWAFEPGRGTAIAYGGVSEPGHLARAEIGCLC